MPASPEPYALRLEHVRDTAALEALAPEWRDLWLRVPDSTPFQSPDWLIPWWRHVGEGALLTFAIRAETGGALVGVAPFYIYRQPTSGERSLFPLGIATTDYLDAVVPPADRVAVMKLIFDALVRPAAEFDTVEWPQLQEGAALLAGQAPPGWSDDVTGGEPCPVLALPADLAKLDQFVPAETLASFGRRIDRAAKKGCLAWRSAATDDPKTLLEAHLDLHGARWRKRGEAGVLAAEAVQRAHRDGLAGLHGTGTLRLHALLLDDRIIATLHGFSDPPGHPGRKVYFYLGGFDPAFERLSPGMLIVGHAIHAAVREGAAAIDFLRGQEAHKYAWGAKDRATWRRTLRPVRAA